MLVQALGEGRTIWRLGELELSGVSGAWIGDLQVREARLRDEAGVWLALRDVRLAWRPQALLWGRLHINTVAVGEADMARRPVLGPPPRSRGLRLSVDAPDLEIRVLRLNEAVAGVAADFRATGGVSIGGGALRELRFHAERLDAPTDSASLGYIHGDANAWRAQADGAPGGVLAGLAGADAGDGVALRALAEGGLERGSGSVALAVGEALALTASGRWGDGAWSAEGALDALAVPALGLGRRLGGPAEFSAAGAAQGSLQAQFRAPNLRLSFGGVMADGLEVTAESDAPQALLDIEGLPVAGIRFEGVLRREGDGLDLVGEAFAQGLSLGGFAGVAQGPLRASVNRAQIDVDLQARFAGEGNVVGRATLEAGAISLAYDRQRGSLRLRSASLEGPGFSAVANGAGEALSGRVESDDLSLLYPSLRGSGAARWRIAREGGAWLLSAQGETSRFGGPVPLDALLGAAPTWSVDGALAEGGLRVTRALVSGPRVRLGARGFVGARTIALDWEASARGPMTMGGVTIHGALDARGRVSGSPAAPRVSGAAEMASLDLGAATLTQVNARFAYADGGAAASLSGLYGDCPISAMGDVAILSEGVVFDAVTGTIAGISVSGRLAIVDNRLDGTFAVAGPVSGLTGGAGSLAGRVGVTGDAAEPEIAAEGSVLGAQFGPALIREGRFAIAGPARAMRIRLSGSGRLGQAAMALSAEGEAQALPRGLNFLLAGQGVVGGQPFATEAPVSIEFVDRGVRVQGALDLVGGRADLSYQQGPDGFSAEANVRELPASVLAALVGETGQGQLSGRAAVRSVGGRLEGDAVAELEGFRLRGRMRDPLDGMLRADLASELLTAELDLSSADGLSASATVRAPVETDAVQMRIAQSDGRQGFVTWRAAGPADALWALTGSQDQALAGMVSGTGEARFGPGVLTGSGALALRDGVFEDRISGARLRDVSLDVRFSDETVTIETLSARDDDGGRLTGEGVVTGARAGRLALHMDDLRFVDRDDVAATADGELAFEWGAEGASLTGALTLQEATIRGTPAAAASIPVLDVIEINRPQASATARAPRRGPVARLDLRITAPGRVYTRYRGFSAEWRLALRVQGTTAAPLLYGEAELVRGDAQLAGRPLDVTRGLIRFRGAPEDASLDLAAEQRGASMTARLVLAGTVGAPEVRFENDAGLPEDEVLPQLLFGVSQQELSALQAAQLAASLSALAGGSAFDLADMTRRLVGLDGLDVRQEADGLFVAGGRYLTRDVYVELARNGLGEAQTRVEWRLSPSLTLVTSFAQSGEQRASLRWRTEEEDE